MSDEASRPDGVIPYDPKNPPLVRYLEATMNLRWADGVLQQAFREVWSRVGEPGLMTGQVVEWRDVPTVVLADANTTSIPPTETPDQRVERIRRTPNRYFSNL